jgi:hypothetical protein
MDYGIILKKNAYELNDREYAKFADKLTFRAKKGGDDAILFYTSKENYALLTNKDLYEIMKKCIP